MAFAARFGLREAAVTRFAPTAPSKANGPPIEALAGLVERVTFHNAESGFCVLRIKARGQRDLVTVVGHAAVITSGERVQMSGTRINASQIASASAASVLPRLT